MSEGFTPQDAISTLMPDSGTPETSERGASSARRAVSLAAGVAMSVGLAYLANEAITQHPEIAQKAFELAQASPGEVAAVIRDYIVTNVEAAHAVIVSAAGFVGATAGMIATELGFLISESGPAASTNASTTEASGIQDTTGNSQVRGQDAHSVGERRFTNIQSDEARRIQIARERQQGWMSRSGSPKLRPQDPNHMGSFGQ